MSNHSTIPCRVRCGINYLDATIGLTIISPRTGRELFFDVDAVSLVPRCLHDRIRAGYQRGGTASFTLAELAQLVELHNTRAARPAGGFRHKPMRGRGWINH